MHENCKNTIFAKTLKTMGFLEENVHFQEIEDRKNKKKRTNIDEQMYVLGDVVSEGFWVGFSDSK